MRSSNQTMQTLFHSLRHMRVKSNFSFDKNEAPPEVVDGVIEMARRLGEYDPKAPVGPNELPLLHALCSERDISVPWLEYFAQDAENNLVFDRSGNQSLGSIMFQRFIQENKSKNDGADSLAWWIEKAPVLDGEEASKWLEKISSISSPSGYSTSDKTMENVQRLIKVLSDRSVGMPAPEVGRPQERWTTRKVWWDRLKEEGRLEEQVLAPSGRWRSMQELFRLGNSTGWSSSGFVKWENGGEDIKPLSAPHGRRKELLEQWVLNAPAEIGVEGRAQRLAAAMAKTEGVLEELSDRSVAPSGRAPDLRSKILPLLLYRTPSGMSLRAWFALDHEGKKTWPWLSADLLGEEFDPVAAWWVAPDGAGVALQFMRSLVGDGAGELPGYRDVSLSRIEKGVRPEWVVGDPSTHAELVDLVVDALVGPRPSSKGKSMGDILVQGKLIGDPVLAEKLRQALDLAHAVTQLNLSSKDSHSRDTNKIEPHLKRLVEDVDSGAWSIGLSARDWTTLFEFWGWQENAKPGLLGQPVVARLDRIKSGLLSLGARQALGEATQPGEPVQRSSRPRL